MQSSTATSTAVVASPTTITLGDTVTLTATVTAATGTPTGLVTFFDGSTPLGSGALSVVAGNSQATFSTSLLSAAGSPHSITAVYQGDATHTGSPSPATSETVNPRTSSTSVSLNPTTVVVGQPSKITVTLTDSGTLPPGTADVFAATGAPATGRAGFTSTLFGDGLVLVAGGTDANGNVLKSAEIFSFSNGTFAATNGTLNTGRTGAVAVLLPNGKVLIAGGSSNGAANGALNTAELFDPIAGTFTLAGAGNATNPNQMTAARFGHTATLLNNGKVLLAGGQNSGVLASAELYDPTADTFTATGNLNTGRTGASATLLGTGKVLVAGGSSDGTVSGALNSAELFDPAGNSGAGTFTAITGPSSTLSALRWQPAGALLLSGKVLIAGGQNSGGALASADLYDPVANTFTSSNHSMSQARANGDAVTLPNSMVLLAGGTTNQAVDLYDPDSDQFDATGSLQQSDNGSISTLLNNGDLLVVGLTTAVTPASDAELYAPTFNPLGTVGLTGTQGESFGAACVLAPTNTTASACTSTVTSSVGTNPHSITGSYPADAVHSTSSNSASLSVTTANTTTAITSNTPNPSQVNQPVTIAAQVTVNAPGTGTPTGNVTISDGVGQTCTTASLDNTGSGSCSLTPVAAGTDTLTATYNGDANFNTSTSAGVSQTVVAPPSISKAFNPTSIPLNGTSTLSFTITNPAANTVALTGVAVTDTLPAGLTVASSSSTACGGTLTTTSPTSITLSGATVATNSQCQFSVTVTGATAGVFTNTSGAVTSSNGGTGNVATATLTVVAPPTISKQYAGGVTSIPLNTTTTVTFTITNPNTTADLSGVAFTDNLPVSTGVGSGTLVVSPTPNVNNTCNGTVTASAGSGVISLSLGTVAHNGSCTLSVDVKGTVAGSTANATGPISSTEGGTGTTSNTANLAVVAPPSISKAFNPTSIPLNGTSTLSFTITNPAANTVALTGVAVTDTLPAGLTVATTSSTACGGTLTTTAPTSITLSGATVAINSQCQFSVTVTGATAGVFTNTSGAVTSTNGGTGNTATAMLTVVAPPTISKQYAGGATSIPLNSTTTVTFTITNPNTTADLSGVGFTDNLPVSTGVGSGTLVVSPTPNVINTCNGTPTAGAGSGVISLSTGTVAHNGSCTLSVDVKGTVAGSTANATGPINSTEGGTGTTSNTANLAVVAPPSISKSFTPTTVVVNQTSTLTFTITNPAANTVAETNVTFSDTLPTGLVVATPNGLTNSCNGTASAAAGGVSVSLSNGSITVGGSCMVVMNVIGTTSGTFNNTSFAVTSDNGGIGNTASASLMVNTRATISMLSFSINPVDVNTPTTVTLTVTDNDPNGTPLTPAGTIVFKSSVGSDVFSPSNSCMLTGSGATASCSVMLTTASANPPSHVITGTFSADNIHSGSGDTQSITVKTRGTASKLSFSISPVDVNQPTTVTLTVTDTDGNGTAETPSGTINFNSSVGSDVFSPSNSCMLSGSGATASCSVMLTAASAIPSSHIITGTFSMDDVHSGSSDQQPVPVHTRSTATTVIFSASNKKVTIATQITVTATVTDTDLKGGMLTPGGTVMFTLGNPTDQPSSGSCTLPITSGPSASCTINLTAPNVGGGPHTVGISYQPTDAGMVLVHSPSTGGDTLTVIAASTATKIISSSNVQNFSGQSSGFTATVQNISQGSTTVPTGAVQFRLDGSLLGSPQGLDKTGTASINDDLTKLSVGSHTITAQYVPDQFLGSPNFMPSDSGASGAGNNEVALTVAPTINNIPGQPIAAVPLNINNTGTTGQISFICNVQLAGNPIPPTLQKNFPICSMDLSHAPTSVTVTITTVAPTTTSMANPAFPGTAPRVAGIYALSTPLAGVLGLLVMGSSRRKKYWSGRKLASLLGMMLVLAVLLLAAGCGGGFSNPGNVVPAGSNGTQPGQYVVSVIGTANGNTVAVATIPVNVQI